MKKPNIQAVLLLHHEKKIKFCRFNLRAYLVVVIIKIESFPPISLYSI